MNARALHLAPLVAILAFFATLSVGAWAWGEEPADLDAGSQVIERMQRVLAKHGAGELHINGGAALSIAMSATKGNTPTWNDLDVLSVMQRPLDQATLKRIADDIGKGGFAEVLLGPITFHTTLRDKPGLHPLAEGIRMRHRSGLRFDVPILYGDFGLRLQGYNSSEGLMIPLQGEHDLRRIFSAMKGRSPQELVANKQVVDFHGKARDVLEGKITLTNEHFLETQPELAALRFLRGMEKLGRYGRKVEGKEGLQFLRHNLGKLIAHAPQPDERMFYPMVVQEQAQKLLERGDPRSLSRAKAIGLDLSRLAKGKIVRRPAPHRRR